MTSELEILFSEIRKFNAYPAGIERICGDVPGNIFFPGGPGIFNAENGMISNREIMVVGPQFDSNLNFNKLHGWQEHWLRMTPPWHTLLLLLVNGGVDPERCFFTNVILGTKLRPESGIRNRKKRKFDVNTKKYFMEHCRSLFRLELEIQKPKVILVLGVVAAKFLCSFHPRLYEWSVIRTIKEADQQVLSVMESVPLTENSSPTLVLLVNPVGRHANIARRRFGEYRGNEAEVKMIVSAVSSP
ncbi:MAG: hypothetical protein NTW10_00325 [Bacteroidetes bacterium]|nr:hypothetical protein [Bacteroidota bacterium]